MRVFFFEMRVTIVSLWTTDSVTAPAGTPPLRRNASTTLISRCIVCAAAPGVRATPLTESDQRTRFDVIGLRAEPVIVIVSRACRAS